MPSAHLWDAGSSWRQPRFLIFRRLLRRQIEFLSSENDAGRRSLLPCLVLGYSLSGEVRHPQLHHSDNRAVNDCLINCLCVCEGDGGLLGLASARPLFCFRALIHFYTLKRERKPRLYSARFASACADNVTNTIAFVATQSQLCA